MQKRVFGLSSGLLLGACVPLAAFGQGGGDNDNGDNGNNGSNGGGERVELDEAAVIVEINATDGDIGFHSLLDADAWKEARIYSPDGTLLFQEQAKGSLADQGLTENAFESDEPLCAPDEEEPDAEVVPLSDFVDRFEAGTYRFTGRTLDNEGLEGTAEMTYDLPAAPEILGFDGTTVTWQPGTDLGRCQDDGLVSNGTIPDPGGVDVVAWEVVVEPADDEAVDPLRVFSVQLPADAPNTVTVPAEFISAYEAEDVAEFKVEIGAIESSGNRTFSEEEFELGGEEETEGEPEDIGG